MVYNLKIGQVFTFSIIITCLIFHFKLLKPETRCGLPVLMFLWVLLSRKTDLAGLRHSRLRHRCATWHSGLTLCARLSAHHPGFNLGNGVFHILALVFRRRVQQLLNGFILRAIQVTQRSHGCRFYSGVLTRVGQDLLNDIQTVEFVGRGLRVLGTVHVAQSEQRGLTDQVGVILSLTWRQLGRIVGRFALQQFIAFQIALLTCREFQDGAQLLIGSLRVGNQHVQLFRAHGLETLLATGWWLLRHRPLLLHHLLLLHSWIHLDIRVLSLHHLLLHCRVHGAVGARRLLLLHLLHHLLLGQLLLLHRIQLGVSVRRWLLLHRLLLLAQLLLQLLKLGLLLGLLLLKLLLLLLQLSLLHLLQLAQLLLKLLRVSLRLAGLLGIQSGRCLKSVVYRRGSRKQLLTGWLWGLIVLKGFAVELVCQVQVSVSGLLRIVPGVQCVEVSLLQPFLGGYGWIRHKRGVVSPLERVRRWASANGWRAALCRIAAWCGRAAGSHVSRIVAQWRVDVEYQRTGGSGLCRL